MNGNSLTFSRMAALMALVAPVMLAVGLAGLTGCRIHLTATEEFNEGVEAQRRGELQIAEEAYRKVIAEDPDDAEAHNSLGLVLARQYRYEEALESFTEAARLEPETGEYHRNRGIILGNLERLPEAEDALQEALRLNAEGAHYHLGRYYMLAGEYAKAVAQFEADRAEPPVHDESEKWLQRAREAEESGESPTAAEDQMPQEVPGGDAAVEEMQGESEGAGLGPAEMQDEPASP